MASDDAYSAGAVEMLWLGFVEPYFKRDIILVDMTIPDVISDAARMPLGSQYI